ncbi:hypothetical protein [Roseivirga pacifica]|uniref:hypothetical protein n=1 Tax=Roseivirga pacifica TaxID=1267423 RepID=UPI003BA9A711
MQTAFTQTGPGGVGTSGGGSSLNIWFDANQQAFTSGTTLATNGQTIESWSNLGLASGAATSSSSTFRPTFSSNALNGYPSLTFDGSNDSFSFTHTITNSGTLFAVASGSFSSGTERVLIRLGEPGLIDYSNAMRMTSSTNMQARLDNGVQIGTINQTITSGTTYLWSYNHRTIGTSQLFTNSSSSGTNTLGVALGIFGSTTSIISGGDFWDGNIAEIIHYSGVVNAAERIIIENYLAAKYGISLSANDIYNEDDGANGDYDHDVAGIGQASDGSSHTDSQSTGILRILGANDLDNNEFLFWGHDNGDAIATETSDVPTGVQARFQRVWRISEQGDVGSVNIRFDLSAFTSVTAADLRLIIDADNDGTFNDETAISGATHLGDDIYQFASVSALGNNLRLTIGTADTNDTPLPVTLVSFNVETTETNTVNIQWATASETDNSHFTIERSINGTDFETLAYVDGAGSVEELRTYQFYDLFPVKGTSYYRLRQTDFNGQFTFSEVKRVLIKELLAKSICYPNPINRGENLKISLSNLPNLPFLSIYLVNNKGNIEWQHHLDSLVTNLDLELETSNLSAGMYNIQFSPVKKLSKRVIIK